ncbi:MAG TPA: hypothetical protein VJL84_07700 [Kiloniellales bacterium]|nr:hypothetical protein [Kiloniellales bacterium]
MTGIAAFWRRVVPLAGLLTLASFVPALAEAPTPGTLPMIGHPKGEVEPIYPSLFVINADGASLKDGVLTLHGVAASSIVFADRPVRAAGHLPTEAVVDEWKPGTDSFDSNPPNATVTVFLVGSDQSKDAVVVLKDPLLTDGDLTFKVDVLEGDLDGADGPAAVFVDIIGMPWTPLSYAGVARRWTRRAIWAGAVAHPYYHPYYRY